MTSTAKLLMYTVVVLGATVLAAPPALGGVRYSVTNLATRGGQESYAFGINSSGQIVGYSDTATDFYDHAFLYDGTMHDLGTFGGRGSSAHGINDLGQVTGSANTSGDLFSHAYLYNGAMHDLGIRDAFFHTVLVGRASIPRAKWLARFTPILSRCMLFCTMESSMTLAPWALRI